MPSINFNRDTSNDLVWNSSTNSYEPASTPTTSGYLTDGNGNLLMFNGKAVYVDDISPSGDENVATISYGDGAYNSRLIMLDASELTFTRDDLNLEGVIGHILVVAWFDKKMFYVPFDDMNYPKAPFILFTDEWDFDDEHWYECEFNSDVWYSSGKWEFTFTITNGNNVTEITCIRQKE